MQQREQIPQQRQRQRQRGWERQPFFAWLRVPREERNGSMGARHKFDYALNSIMYLGRCTMAYVTKDPRAAPFSWMGDVWESRLKAEV